MKTYTQLIRYLLSVSIILGAQLLSAQSLKKNINLNTERGTLIETIERIRKLSGVEFYYDASQLEGYRVAERVFQDKTIEDVLRYLLHGTGLEYREIAGSVTIRKRNGGTQNEQRRTSQDGIVQGQVQDSVGNAIEGVTVALKNHPNSATTTNQNGLFIMKVPQENSTLVFSQIGFTTREVTVSTFRSKPVVVLEQQQNNLEEVVVTGFGITQKKASLVGAVETVRPDELVQTSSNLTTAFAGRIAGVIATQSSGLPGADAANFWIRGVSTFGSNTSPLIVLDGVEIVPEMLNSIAPETIESFSVLKDATATALYGSRGANGVMIITTKTGRKGERMNVNVRAQTGISAPTKVQEIADGVAYMESYNEAYQDLYGTDYFSQEKIAGTREGKDPYLYPNNDWYKLLFKDFTHNSNANINVTGGTSKVDYFLNASAFWENGIYRESDYLNYNTNVNLKKYSFQSNVSAAVTSTTRVSVKMNSLLQYIHQPYEDRDDLFLLAMRANPVLFPATFPAQAGDNFIRYGNAPSWDGGATTSNPVALLDRGYGDRHTSYLTTVFNADQDLPFITEGLKARAMASFYNKAYAATYRAIIPSYFWLDEEDPLITGPDGGMQYNAAPIGPAGVHYLNTSTGSNGYREYGLQGSLEYSRNFADTHDVNALVLYHRKERVDNLPASDEYAVLPYRQQGLAGRITYGYKGRYLMEANFGYNGSENFMKGKRWGFFPSLALGWNIANEPFFAPLRDAISQLKLRGSWGKSGNDVLNVRFPYITTVNTGQTLDFFYGPNLTRATGATIQTEGSPMATWEESEKWNLGLEIGIQNDLTLIVDAFRENRTGIFMQRRSLPSSTGYSGTEPYANIGAVRNKGVDASLDYRKNFSDDLHVSVRGTFTYAHNEVTAIDEPELLYPYTSRIGQPINTSYGLIAEGLFEDETDIANSPDHTYNTVRPGDIKYADLNGDGRIDDNDRTALGNPTRPEIIYGFGSSVRYKRFDASFFFQGAAKVSLLMDMHPFVSPSYSGFGMTKWMAEDHWSVDNPDPDAAYPRLSANYNRSNNQPSSFWSRNASFLRLKSAEVGFTYKKARIYLLGTNLFTFSEFEHWDPELGGSTGLRYPLQRTYTMGLQYNF